MEAWVTFWKILLIVVFALFYAVVLFVIPFGLRDGASPKPWRI